MKQLHITLLLCVIASCRSHLLCQYEGSQEYMIECLSIGIQDHEVFAKLLDPVPEEAEYLQLRSCRIRDIAQGAFEGLEKLHDLDLSDNHLSDLRDDLFATTPAIVHLNLSSNLLSYLSPDLLKSLASLRELDVTNNGFVQLQIDHVPTLNSLDVSNNLPVDLKKLMLKTELKSLTISHGTAFIGDKGRIRMPSLVHLRMTDHEVLLLQEMMLRSSTELHTIDLARNNIDSLPGGFFIQNKKLILLNLSHNQLSSLDVKIFSSNRNLRHLNLAFNKIRRFDSETLANQKDLVHLTINDNLLRQWNCDSFPMMLRLKSLNLANNLISHIEAGCFVKMSQLIELDLAGNRFVDLQPGLFYSILGLKHLHLANNDISKFPPTLVRNLRNLTVLDLSMNLLTRLEPGFASMDNLRTLKVSCNFLPTLPQDFSLRQTEREFVVYLHGNPLRCRCLNSLLARDVTWLLSKKKLLDRKSSTCIMGGTTCDDRSIEPVAENITQHWRDSLAFFGTCKI